jgi:NADH-quinone oxidoreductase subunit L
VVTLPLILLAIPSAVIGFLTVGPMLFGGWFGDAIVVREAHDTLAAAGAKLWHDEHGWVAAATSFGLHFIKAPAFWLAFSGFAAATYIYLFNPALAERLKGVFALPFRVLERKYGFDDFYQAVFARGSLGLGRAFWRGGDAALIDGVLVDGSATFVDRLAAVARQIQSGMLYHYAFAMILGLIAVLGTLIYTLR